MERATLLAVSILLSVAFATSVALAQQSGGTEQVADASQHPSGVGDREPSGYGEAIDRALAAYELMHWDEAHAMFTRAHDIYPNARTARGLGMVEFERRNYEECIRYLDEALSSTTKPLDPELRAGTEQLRDQARIARAEAHGAERRPLDLRDGETRSLSMASGPAMPKESSTHAPVALHKNPWLWAVAGAVTAGVLVGAALLFEPAAKARTEPATSSNTPPGSTLRGLVAW